MSSLRLPNINADTQKGQLEQIRSYLYQLTQELNWALKTLESTAAPAAAAAPRPNAQEQARATFAQVKALIIKSADIVEAYYDKIEKKLSGSYVARSDFGTYREQTEATLQANSTGLTALFDHQQQLSSQLESVGAVLQTDENGTLLLGSEAWCRIGVVDQEESGFPIYGMEIGQRNSRDGEQVLRRFAQYRSDGVHLFDQNGVEVATVSDLTLAITNARIRAAAITESLQLGGYGLELSDGVVVKWIG